MNRAGYVRRVEAVVAALDVLDADGPLDIVALAGRVGAGTDPHHLREDLGHLLEHGLIDVLDGGLYAASGEDPLRALGVDRLDVADAAALVLLGRAWLDVHPERADLASALDALQRHALAGLAGVEAAPAVAAEQGPVATTLREAIEHRRRVKIRYARTWEQGVVEPAIEPYRLVLTRRGWECDAASLDALGQLRTYVLSRVERATLLLETFAAPGPRVVAELAEMRRLQTVRLVLPQGTRWVAEQHAEHVRVLREDTDMELSCDLLPPVDRRVGLILTTAGPTAMVVEPAHLRDAGADFARALLEHYGA